MAMASMPIGLSGTDQIAHGIGDFPVNQIDRGHFDYAAFQPAGFSIYYA
jgi:hypothetical protein